MKKGISPSYLKCFILGFINVKFDIIVVDVLLYLLIFFKKGNVLFMIYRVLHV